MTSDAAMREAIRDVCEAVADLAAGSVHLLGTQQAGAVIDKVLRVSQNMDTLDAEGGTDD